MIGGRTRSNNLHFAPRRKRRFPVRLAVAMVVILVLLAAAGAAKAAVAQAPGLQVRRVFGPTATMTGAAPRPAWPQTGQAAVEVEGLPPLGSSGSGRPIPIASLAKIMTAYVVLRDHPITPGQPGFTTTVGPAAVADYQQRLAAAESVIQVVNGETINEAQLLDGLLVASGNNFAILLADYDAGSVPAFVAKMQAAATELRMTHTTYTDPSGLEATTVSTASDQLLLASRAMALPVFAHTVALTSVNLPVAGQLPNFFKAVGTGGYTGIKTGSDSTAGGCLVFANRQSTGGHTYTILGAVLGQDRGVQSTSALIAAALQASDALVHTVTSAVQIKTLVPAGTTVAVVTNAQGKEVAATTNAPLTRLGFGGMTVPVLVSLSAVGRSVDQGQDVAEVSLDSGDHTAASAASTMPAVTFRWKLLHDY